MTARDALRRTCDGLPDAGWFSAVVAAGLVLGACFAAGAPRTSRPDPDGATVTDAAPAHGAPQALPPTDAAPAPRDAFPLPPPPPSAGSPPPPPRGPAAPGTSAPGAASSIPGQFGPQTTERAPPVVRVVLTSTGASGADVEVAGDWTLTSQSGTVLAQGRGLRARLERVGTMTRLGTMTVPDSGATFTPKSDGDLRVGARRYPGKLRIPPTRGASVTAPAAFRPQIEIDVETYLEGVVAGELPPQFPREARRAQAIVARTYLVTQPTTTWDAPWIQVDDTGLTDQEFAGISGTAAQRDAVRDAVRSTRGLLVFDGLGPVRTWYHSICGGHTCPSAPVFNVPRTSPLGGVPCTTCVGTKYYRWSAKIPGARVAKAAGLTGTLQSVRTSETTPDGRALRLEVRAGGRTAKVHAAEFRLGVGPSELRSTWLDRADVVGGELVVSGRGWGHGVGMCQWGAKGLADRGSAAESILAHYYPGASLRRAW